MRKWIVFLGIVLTMFPVLADSMGFYSLKYDRVNMRAGPGERFPIRWLYQEKNYPVEMLEAIEDWRQVREADGTVGWVPERMLKSTRYVVIQVEDKLLSSPSVSGRVVAYVQPGVVAQIHSCPIGDYCLLQFKYNDKKVEGWFPRRFVWGIYDGEIIE